MKALEEISDWVKTLTGSEKRFITLLGKARAGSGGSQHLRLFDWLCQSESATTVPKELQANLHTLNLRLKELILDALRLLHKHSSVDSRLRAQLDEIQFLLQRDLVAAAQRLIRRTQAQAMDACRYEVMIQCLSIQQKMEMENRRDLSRKLMELEQQQNEILTRMQNLQELRSRHDQMRAVVLRVAGQRDAGTEREVLALTRGSIVNENWDSGSWMERALAGNILGTKELFERQYNPAFNRYRTLLEEWVAQPEWQLDQAELFMLICKNYQNACFFASKSKEDLERNLSFLPSFSNLPPALALNQQYLLYTNRVALLLSNANFGALQVIKPEIVNWISAELPRLGEVKAITLLFNLAVAEFLDENYSAANQLVNQILQLPNRKAREDARNFCRLFQSILHYELGNVNLNEFLIRSGKRHFTKNSFEDEFELMVLNYLEKILRGIPAKDQKIALNLLSTELDALSQNMAGQPPIVGFMEIRLWVKSKQTGESLTNTYKAEIN